TVSYDAHRDQTRQEALVLAGVHVQVHDCAGVPGRHAALPGRPAVLMVDRELLERTGRRQSKMFVIQGRSQARSRSERTTIPGAIVADWQLPLALACVACATAYLCLRGWRRWRGSAKGCGQGCGCAGGKAELATAAKA